VIEDGDRHLSRSYLDAGRDEDDAFSVRILAGIACFALALVTSSCRGAATNVVSGDVTLIRQSHNGDTYPAALLGGTLAVKDGCVAVRGDDGPRFVLWSALADLRSTGDGLEVVDDGGRAAVVGSQVTIGGGAGGQDWAEGLVGELPASCSADESYGSYWIAAPGSLNAVSA
jgi:hypothetical protein